MAQTTTIARVRGIAPHLSSIKDPDIQIFIDDAVTEKTDYNFDPKYEEKVERYLAAHFATLSHPRADSEQIDTLKKTYRIPDSNDPKIEKLLSTAYGIEVIRLLKKRSGPNILVVS